MVEIDPFPRFGDALASGIQALAVQVARIAAFAGRAIMSGYGRTMLALAITWVIGALDPTPTRAEIVRVGEVPLITGGGFYVALEKGYFAKVGLTVQTKSFNDGAMVVPSIVAGELDIAAVTAAASLFNSIAKGAPLAIVFDRGNNRAGRGFTAVNVTPELYAAGLRSAADFGLLRGKKIGIGAIGSINQYDASIALIGAGLDPRKDVQWISNVPQPDLIKMLNQKQLDATSVAYQIAVVARDNNWGPIVAMGDEIVPDAALAMYTVNRNYIASNRDIVIRFGMAYLQGAKEFNAAAMEPDRHPDILAILAKSTVLNRPELLKAIAPHWSYVNEDGISPEDARLLGGLFHLRGKEGTTRSALGCLGRARSQGPSRSGETVRQVAPPAGCGCGRAGR
jgi:NitT/TauT family transport system substrate-binding protein